MTIPAAIVAGIAGQILEAIQAGRHADAERMAAELKTLATVTDGKLDALEASVDAALAKEGTPS